MQKKLKDIHAKAKRLRLSITINGDLDDISQELLEAIARQGFMPFC